MNSTDLTLAATLSNLRKARMALQKQEQMYIQKLYTDVLQQISKLITDNQLTLQDVERALHDNPAKPKWKPKPKFPVQNAVSPVTTNVQVTPAHIKKI